jgi:hypothetical protein
MRALLRAASHFCEVVVLRGLTSTDTFRAFRGQINFLDAFNGEDESLPHSHTHAHTLSPSLSPQHTHSHTHTHKYTHKLFLSLFFFPLPLSLSLSLSLSLTHTHILPFFLMKSHPSIFYILQSVHAKNF